jgi:hypothetical protein
MFASAVDALQMGFLRAARRLRRLDILEQNLAVANHRVQRRAQFVAHFRQKNRFRAIGLIRQFLGLLQTRRQLPVPLALALEFGTRRHDRGVENRHPGHVDDRRKDRNPAHRGEFRERHDLGKPHADVSQNENNDVAREHRDHDQGTIGQIEKSEQEADDQPGEERRADAAVVERPEQRRERQQLHRNNRGDRQVSRLFQDEGHGPKAANANDHRPAGPTWSRVGAVEEYADRLGQEGPGDMGENEIAPYGQFGSFRLDRVGDEPINRPHDGGNHQWPPRRVARAQILHEVFKRATLRIRLGGAMAEVHGAVRFRAVNGIRDPTSPGSPPE